MPINDWNEPNYWLSVMTLSGNVRPLDIMEALEKENIESRPVWKPMHLQPFFEEYDYIVDAVDTVTAKIALVMKAKEMNIPIISSMGAGNKLDASKFEVADIYKTSVCPLAKVMRRELKKRGVKKLKVVYSKEEPIKPVEDMAISCRSNCICPPGAKHKCTERRAIPGSVAFVPSVVGLIIAGEVVKDLVKDC